MAFTTEERREARGYLFELTSRICDPRSMVVITEVETGRGSTDYFTVDLFYVADSGKIERRNLSFYVAAATGKNMRGGRDEFGVKGYGVSKYQLIARDIYTCLNLPEVADSSQAVTGNNPAFTWERG